MTGPVQGGGAAASSSSGLHLHKQAYLSMAKAVACLVAAQPHHAPAVTTRLADRFKAQPSLLFCFPVGQD